MILVILGSGGHTSEMLRLIDGVHGSKMYICSYGDEMSKRRVNNVIELVRPRLPAQPLLFAIPRVILSVLHTIYLMIYLKWTTKIDLVIGNGPGLCVMIFIMSRLMGIKTLYVESFARVYSLSLTGQLLQYISIYFIVQWKENKGTVMEWIV